MGLLFVAEFLIRARPYDLTLYKTEESYQY